MIKQSKTDQARRRVKVYTGQTDNDLCPVSALLAYLFKMGTKPGPLFMWENGKPLNKDLVLTNVRTALEKAGLQD